jgi:hypothetical protein
MDLIAKIRAALRREAAAERPQAPRTPKPARALAPSAWAERVLADSQAESARRMIAHALTAAGKSKPSQAFLKTSRALMTQDRGLAAQAMAWLDAYLPDPHRPDPNEDMMRGLLWMLAVTDEDAIAPRVGQYCELYFKKVPAVGARSIKLGNGAMQALATMGGLARHCRADPIEDAGALSFGGPQDRGRPQRARVGAQRLRGRVGGDVAADLRLVGGWRTASADR